MIIKCFEFNNCYYFYEARENNIYNVERNAYIELLQYEQNQLPFNQLQDHDIISKNDYENLFEESKHPATDVIEYYLNRGLGGLALQITQNCNFSCRYCQYTDNNPFSRNKNNENMSIDLAKKSIDFFGEHSIDSTSLNFAFCGGEPLLNYQTLEFALEYIAKKFKYRNISINLTTNASLLTRKAIELFNKYNVNLLISLDGPRDIQNRNRKLANNGLGSFDIVIENVNLLMRDFFDYFSSNVRFNSVLLDDCDKSVVLEFFNSIGVSSEKVKLRRANLNGISYRKKILPLYMDKQFVDQNKYLPIEDDYLTFKSIYKCKSAVPKMWHHGGPCLIGVNRLMVDCNGVFYPCEKTLESEAMIIGNINDSFDLLKIKSLLNIGSLSHKQCQKCWAFRYCSICSGQCINPITNELDGNSKKIECKNVQDRTLLCMKRYIEENNN